MTTPDPTPQPTSISERWDDAEAPVKVTVAPEQPIDWIDAE